MKSKGEISNNEKKICNSVCARACVRACAWVSDFCRYRTRLHFPCSLGLFPWAKGTGSGADDAPPQCGSYSSTAPPVSWRAALITHTGNETLSAYLQTDKWAAIQATSLTLTVATGWGIQTQTVAELRYRSLQWILTDQYSVRTAQ
jgi:hypothetical protein